MKQPKSKGLDWLEEIKRDCNAYDKYDPPNYPVGDVRRLIEEVERLRAENLELAKANPAVWVAICCRESHK